MSAKNKFLSLFLLSALLALLCVPSVSAYTYDEHWISGGWSDGGSYPNYKDVSRSETSGIMELEYSHVDLSNSQGLEANFTINSLKGDRVNWWWVNGVKRFWCAIDLTDGATHAFNKFYIAHEQGILVQTLQIKVGSQEIVPYTDWFSGAFDSSTNVTDLDFTLQVLRINDTVCAVYLMELNTVIRSTDMNWQFSNMVWNETFAVSPSFWANANFKVYVAHQGTGTCDVTFTGIEIKTITPNQRFDYGEKVDDGWVGKAWAMLTGLWSVGQSLFSLASGLFIAIAPLLPILGVMWVADAVMTSVATMSFKPIGAFMEKVIALVEKAYHMVASAVSAVGDLLPF